MPVESPPDSSAMTEQEKQKNSGEWQEKLAPFLVHMDELFRLVGIVSAPILRRKIENQIFEALKTNKENDIPLILGRAIIIQNQKELMSGAATMFDLKDKNSIKKAAEFIKQGNKLTMDQITEYLAKRFPLPSGQEKSDLKKRLFGDKKTQTVAERYAELLRTP